MCSINRYLLVFICMCSINREGFIKDINFMRKLLDLLELEKVLIWISLWLYDIYWIHEPRIHCNFAVLSIIAASGFLPVWGRLYLALFRYPIDSIGQQQKLNGLQSYQINPVRIKFGEINFKMKRHGEQVAFSDFEFPSSRLMILTTSYLLPFLNYQKNRVKFSFQNHKSNGAAGIFNELQLDHR